MKKSYPSETLIIDLYIVLITFTTVQQWLRLLPQVNICVLTKMVRTIHTC